MTQILDISIIIPVYNGQAYLHQCLDSILSQNYESFEVILINDGSTDDSGRICNLYAKQDPRVHVYHKKNGGVSSARNMGLEKAQGKFITFIDADDKVSSDYCKTICTKMGNYDMGCFTSVIHIAESNKDLIYQFKDELITNPSLLQQEALALKDCKELDGWNLFGYPWNKVFKKEIIKSYNISFNQNLYNQEDEIFTISYFRYIKSLKLIPEILYYYELKSTGLTYAPLSYQHFWNFATSLKNLVLYFTEQKLLTYELNRIFRSYWKALIICPYSKQRNKIITEACYFFHQIGTNTKLIKRKYRLRFFSKFLAPMIVEINLLLHKHK